MELSKKSISIAFVIILAITILVSLLGMLLMSHQPLVLQGQIETTEIRISGKLPGRVDSFLVREGDWVQAGDTLVVINSPTIEAKYRQVNALEQVAQEQNKKIDAGTRRQIIATAGQLWNKTKSDLTLAQTTYQRILALYKDSVVTSQRKDEVEAMYRAAQAAERAAYEQYQMAVDGAQSEDRASARSMVDAARSTVDEVSALLVDSRLMPQFKMDGTFRAEVPAIGKKDVEFRIYYISPLGSFATWKSTKQTGSYDMQTFEIHARPTKKVEGLRPGMSVLLTIDD